MASAGDHTIEEPAGDQGSEEPAGEPLRRWVWTHPTLVLTSVYLLVCAFGTLLHALLLQQFGINYFLFAQPQDFLMSAFRESTMGIAAAGGIAGGSGLWWLLRRNRSQLERYREHWWGRWLIRRGDRTFGRLLRGILGTVIILPVYFTFLEQHRLHAGRGDAIALELTNGAIIGDDANRVTVISATSQFLFTYEPSSKRVSIWSLGNVRRISPLPDAEPASQPN